MKRRWLEWEEQWLESQGEKLEDKEAVNRKEREHVKR